MADTTETIFYTKVSDQVKITLDARKSYYSSEDRSSGAHAWLFQKMAWATAYAHNTVTEKDKYLTVSTKGGIDKNGLYKNSILPTASYPEGGRFIPKPHLDSVTISSKGDFGSLRDAEINFTVHSLTDLDACQPFFDIGADITVEYGWNNAGGAGGPSGTFTGKLYNFNYTVNTDGSFFCKSFAIGAGINVLSGDMDASSDDNGQQVTDANKNVIKATNFTTLLDVIVNIDAVKSLQPNDISKDGIGCVSLPTSWGDKEDQKEHVSFKNEYFISLEKIVDIVNSKILLTAGGTKFKELKFICNSTYTNGNIPGTNKLVSGNPKEVLFPGYGLYGNNKFFYNDSQKYAQSFIEGDLSKIMISIKWLKNMFKQMGKITLDYQKNPDKSIYKFFKNIFDLIYLNSGERFKLTTVTNPKNNNEILIVDGNFVDERIEPYSITAITKDSICRSVSLTSKLPSEFTMAAFVANSSTLISNGSVMPALNDGISPGQQTQQEIDNTTQSAQEQFNTAKKNIDNGPSDNNDNPITWDELTSAMQSAIKRLYSGTPDNGTDPKKEALPVPIDFSCTLDGIEGFIFGNAITCNYLPATFKSANLGFTVTTVSHRIVGNDWATTLSTVCRVLPFYKK
jgi:hypothetical protein